MLTGSGRPEIDHHTIKLIVGIIAITLASLTSALSGHDIPSVSASYHEGGLARDIFVGFLFAIGAFLFAYNGEWRIEFYLSRIAAISALAIAIFPCKCGGHPEYIANVHGSAAALMFGTLSVFCWVFFARARKKTYAQAKWRAVIYAVCGLAITAAVVLLAVDHFLDDVFTNLNPRFTYYGEFTGLVAFGIAWLIASRVLPIISNPDERFSVF